MSDRDKFLKNVRTTMSRRKARRAEGQVAEGSKIDAETLHALLKRGVAAGNALDCDEPPLVMPKATPGAPGGVPLDDEVLAAHALDAWLIHHGKSLEVTRVAALPTPVYGFNTDGWVLFYVSSRSPEGGRVVGCGEYVAVHPATGETRYLGCVGE